MHYYIYRTTIPIGFRISYIIVGIRDCKSGSLDELVKHDISSNRILKFSNSLMLTSN